MSVAAAAAVTAMLALVTVGVPLVSAAVIVWLGAVFSVTLKLAVPLTMLKFEGNPALVSVEVIWIGPVYPVATTLLSVLVYPVTVPLIAVPAVVVVGRPVSVR